MRVLLLPLPLRLLSLLLRVVEGWVSDDRGAVLGVEIG